MPRAGRVLVLALLAALCAAAAGAEDKLRLRGIKGQDDRLRVSSAEAPWRAIGRLNKRTGGFCTATLIHQRVVLTAAHCLWNGRTRHLLPPVSVHFVAGYTGGEWLAHSAAARLVASPRWRADRALAPDTLQNDWALVVLAHPVGPAIAPIPIAAGLRMAAPHTQAGYSMDKAHVLTVHKDCRILGRVKGAHLLAHGCDAVPGDSGSPILATADGGFAVAAIHVATIRRGQTYGLAVPAAAFRDAAQRLITELGRSSP